MRSNPFAEQLDLGAGADHAACDLEHLPVQPLLLRLDDRYPFVHAGEVAHHAAVIDLVVQFPEVALGRRQFHQPLKTGQLRPHILFVVAVELQKLVDSSKIVPHTATVDCVICSFPTPHRAVLLRPAELQHDPVALSVLALVHAQGGGRVVQCAGQRHRVGPHHGAADLTDGEGRPTIFLDADLVPDCQLEGCVPGRDNAASFDVGFEIGGEWLTFHPGFYVLRVRTIREAMDPGGGICGVVMETCFLQVYFGIGFKICAEALHNGGFFLDEW